MIYFLHAKEIGQNEKIVAVGLFSLIGNSSALRQLSGGLTALSDSNNIINLLACVKIKI